MKNMLKKIICFMLIYSMFTPIYATNTESQTISKQLYVTRYAQHNKDWKNAKLGTCTQGQTIGSHGSALVAYTMVYNYLNNSLETPDKINEKMGNYCNLQWNKISSISIINKNSKISNEELNNLVEKYISLDLPIILQIRKYDPKSKYSDSEGYRYHFIVANGYNKKEKTIQIKDPGGNNYLTFEKMKEKGWETNKYYVLNKK